MRTKSPVESAAIGRRIAEIEYDLPAPLDRESAA